MKSERLSIDEIANRFRETLPHGLRNAGDALEDTLRSSLQAGLARLDVVSRDEYEVQKAVLQRTRERLNALERKVSELEQAARAVK